MSAQTGAAERRYRSGGWVAPAGLAVVAGFLSPPAMSQAEETPQSTIDLYGFAMLDMGYQKNQNDPDWFDVLRPTKLPSVENQFGGDGHFFAGVRQSRFGVKGNTQTSAGEVKTIFEFELFGTGVDAGQTTFRLRHAYGELGHWGAGQTWSPFMDIDVFPNSIEYWGPNGMAFFRNVQIRWMPIQGDTRLTIALERPGASADQGDFEDRISLQNVVGRFPYPDVSAEFRLGGGDWGYVEIAGIWRYMKWEDNTPGVVDLSGSDTGWGVNLSSNLKLGRMVLKLQALYGEGIQNYMNDAPEDVGVRTNPGNVTQPLVGEALPVLGLVAFVDINWSERMTSTIGYSLVDIDNTDGQSADAFKRGDYALANVLFYPAKNVMFGPEVQWGRRENARDGFTSDDLRFQFSVKYNFSRTFGGG
jgi:hypothetical protein